MQNLRIKKQVKTKKAIIDAFSEKLKKTKGENVSIKDICEKVEISEQTFFNYFPKKEDLLLYCAWIWSVEVSWWAKKREEKTGNALEAIKAIFKISAEKYYVANPFMILETINLDMRNIFRKSSFGKKMSLEEIGIFFPDREGMDQIIARLGFSNIVREYIKKAKKNKEIKSRENTEDVLLVLKTLFYGGATAVGAKTRFLKKIYDYQVEGYLKTITKK